MWKKKEWEERKRAGRGMHKISGAALILSLQVIVPCGLRGLEEIGLHVRGRKLQSYAET